jgi:hypothetical protein
MRQRVLAGFDGYWPDLDRAVAGFYRLWCCRFAAYPPEQIRRSFSTLTKVRPASDIKALPSHTTVKATTGRKEQFKTVAHPAAHAEEGLSSKKRGRR